MNNFRGRPLVVLAIMLLWRVGLLVFTVQPIPSNDAFGYDGAVVNFLRGGAYCNPSFALLFPISGTQVYAGYPPLYELALLLWMQAFGTSLVSAMTLHLTLFAISAYLVLALIHRFFPAAADSALVALLLFGFTFGDRPESLAYVFGLGALWLVARQISSVLGPNEPPAQPGGPAPTATPARTRGDHCLATALALVLTLLLGLYTSVIVGAYFFGTGFLACCVACVWRPSLRWFAPFIGAAVLFAGITGLIVWREPLWWAGFMESARQQSVTTSGFRMPPPVDLIKLARTAPVFLVGLGLLPLLFRRRNALLAQPSAWLALVAGAFGMGWMLLGLAVTLLAPTYVSYTGFCQILLAAGILALVRKLWPQRERWLRTTLAVCVLVVSVRALGMTTWGVACAWKNSYASTQAVLDTELKPFISSREPVLLSSAYLYRAAALGVKNPVHCDWYFDHAHWTNHAQMAGLIRCQPPKLVLTQFDYYRGFEVVLDQLRQQPGLVDVQVRNLAAVRPPDAIPAFQRVVQHISWAPVIVDLRWNRPHPP